MQILKNNVDLKCKHGNMVIMGTNCDDFYVLSNILTQGDKVSCKTTRKISFDGGKTQQKITTNLEISIETISADLEYGILYVKGKVCKENEFVALGSYHTLNIELNQKMVIEKEEWSAMDVSNIKDATKEQHNICFVIFYEKDCVISSYGTSQSRILSKHEPKSKNFGSILNALKSYESKFLAILIASCFKTGKDFHQYVSKHSKSKYSFLQLSNDYKNISNTKVISKIVLDPSFSQSFANAQYVKDLLEFQKVFPKIKSGDPGTFLGYKELGEVCNYGALEKLFITDKNYRPATVERRKVIEKILNEAHLLRAKIFVIPVENELGEEFQKMGGIAGTLLFSYK